MSIYAYNNNNNNNGNTNNYLYSTLACPVIQNRWYNIKDRNSKILSKKTNIKIK